MRSGTYLKLSSNMHCDLMTSEMMNETKLCLYQNKTLRSYCRFPPRCSRPVYRVCNHVAIELAEQHSTVQLDLEMNLINP